MAQQQAATSSATRLHQRPPTCFFFSFPFLSFLFSFFDSAQTLPSLQPLLLFAFPLHISPLVSTKVVSFKIYRTYWKSINCNGIKKFRRKVFNLLLFPSLFSDFRIFRELRFPSERAKFFGLEICLRVFLLRACPLHEIVRTLHKDLLVERRHVCFDEKRTRFIGYVSAKTRDQVAPPVHPSTNRRNSSSKLTRSWSVANRAIASARIRSRANLFRIRWDA